MVRYLLTLGPDNQAGPWMYQDMGHQAHWDSSSTPGGNKPQSHANGLRLDHRGWFQINGYAQSKKDQLMVPALRPTLPHPGMVLREDIKDG